MYDTALKIIADWAGDAPIATVTRKRVQVLKAELLKPGPDGKPRPTRAHSTLRVLRTLFQFAADSDLVKDNPAIKPGIEAPPARDQIWPDHCIDAMVAAADRISVPSYGAATRWGCPSIGTAVLLAEQIGQREADILALNWSQWKDGRILLRQKKTKVWIKVMAMPELAARLDALQAAYKASLPADKPAPVDSRILLREVDGQPYTDTYFQRQFRRVKLAATAGYTERRGHVADDDGFAAGPALDPCPDLEGLQYRDLRRTAVVRLAEAEVDLPGIAAISGHQIESCKRILEVYLPRTTKMADAAILKWGAHRDKERGIVRSVDKAANTSGD